MEVLILGRAGAMGAPVVQILADRNNHFVVTTRQNKKSQNKYIQFVRGDAHDLNFVKGLLVKTYDAVIDFTIYTPDEFRTFSKLYMEKSRQYVFLSSARVYADSPEARITEETSRLLESIPLPEPTTFFQTVKDSIRWIRQKPSLFNSKGIAGC